MTKRILDKIFILLSFLFFMLLDEISSEPSVVSVRKEQTCESTFQIEFSRDGAYKRIRISDEDCKINWTDQNMVECNTEKKQYTEKVSLEADVEDGNVLRVDQINVENDLPQIISVKSEVFLDNENREIEIIFDQRVDCLDSTAFSVMMETPEGEQEVGYKHIILTGRLLRMLLRSTFTNEINQERLNIYLKLDKSVYNLNKQYLNQGKKGDSEPEYERMFTKIVENIFYEPKTLIVTEISPEVVYTNTSPLTFMVFLNRACDAIKEIKEVQLWNSFTKPMIKLKMKVIGVKKRKFLVQTDSIPTAGVYYLKVWNRLSEDITSNLARTEIITVKQEQVIQTISSKFACQNKPLSIDLIFSQTVSRPDFTYVALENKSDSLPLHIDGVKDGRNLKVLSGDNGYKDHGTYSLQVVNSLGMSLKAEQKFKIGYGYEARTFSPKTFVSGCELVIFLTLNKAVDLSEISKVSILSHGERVSDFEVVETDELNSNILKLKLSIGVATSGSYQIAVYDKCDKEIMATSTLAIVDKPIITSIYPSCGKPNTTNKISISFQNSLDDGLVNSASIKSSSGDSNTLIPRLLNDNRYSFTSASLVPDTFTIQVTDSCGNNIVSSDNFEVGANFAFTKLTPSIFDTNKIRVKVGLKEKVKLSQIKKVYISNANHSYTATYTKYDEYTLLVENNGPIEVANDYRVSIRNLCNEYFKSIDTIEVVELPVFDSVSPLYLKSNASTKWTVTFRKSINQELLTDIGLYTGIQNKFGTIENKTQVDSKTLSYDITAPNKGTYYIELKTTSLSSVIFPSVIVYDNLNVLSVSKTFPKSDTSFTLDIQFSYVPEKDRIGTIKLIDTLNIDYVFEPLSITQIGDVISLTFDAVNIATYSIDVSDLFAHSTISYHETLRKLGALPSIIDVDIIVFYNDELINLSVLLDQAIDIEKIQSVYLSKSDDSIITLNVDSVNDDTVRINSLSPIIQTGVFDLELVFLTYDPIISSLKIKIIEPLDTKNIIFTPTIKKINEEFTLTLDFQQDLIEGQVVEAAIHSESDVSYENPISIILESQNTNHVVVKSDGILEANNYKLRVKDLKGSFYVVPTVLQIVTVPTIIAVSKKCFIKNSKIETSVTFTSNLLNGLFKSASLYDANKYSVLSFSMGSPQKNVINLTSSTDEINAGIFTLTVTDFEDNSSTEAGDKIYVLDSPKFSITPKIKKPNKAITIKVSSSLTLLTGQITEAAIYKDKDTSFSSPIPLNITSYADNQIVFDTITITNLGKYILRLKDLCGNFHVASSVLQIVNLPTISFLTENCFYKNSIITTNVNFNYDKIPNGAFTSAALYNDENKPVINLKANISADSFWLLNITSSNENNLKGIFTLKLTDFENELVTYSKKPVYIIESPKYSFSPSIKKQLDAFEIVVTADVDMIPGQIIDAALYTENDYNNSNPVPLEIKSQTFNQIILGTYGVSAEGNYVLKLKDICGNMTKANNILQIVRIPSITSVKNKCFLRRLGVTTCAIFNSKVVNGVFVSAALYDSNDAAVINMNLRNPKKNELRINNLSGKTPAGIYSLKFTDFENNLVSYSDELIYIFEILKFTATPSMKKKDEAFDIIVTSNVKMVPGQIVQANLHSINNTGYSSPIPLTISSLGNNQVSLSTPGLAEEGAYILRLKDRCGVIYKPAYSISIVTIPTTTSSFNKCFNANDKIDFPLTLSSNLATGVFTSGALYDEVSNSVLSLNLGTPSGSTLLVTINAESVQAGIYDLKLTDYENNLNTFTNEPIYLLENPSFTFSPLIKKINEPITITITSDVPLVTGQIIEAKLYAQEDGQYEFPTDLTINSQIDKTLVLDTITLQNIKNYVIRFKDVCGKYFVASSVLQIFNGAELNSVSNKCFTKNSNIDTTLTFDSEINSQTFATGAFLNLRDNAFVNMTFGTISGTDMTVTNSIATGNSGVFNIELTDSTGHAFIFDPFIYILEPDTPNLSFEPLMKSKEDSFKLTVTSDVRLVSEQIVEAALFLQDDTDFITPLDLNILTQNDYKVVLKTDGVSGEGNYILMFKDVCDNYFTGSSVLKVITIPNINSVSNNCFVKNTDIETTLNFDSSLSNGVFVAAAFYDTKETLVSDLALAAPSDSTLQVTKTGGIENPNILTLKLTDFDSRTYTYTSDSIYIIDTTTPQLSFEPTLTMDNKLFTLTVDSVEKFISGQIVEASLYQETDTNYSTPYSLEIFEQTDNQIILDSSEISDLGTYKLRLKDICGNFYASNTSLKILKKPKVLSASKNCYVKNQNIDTVLTFEHMIGVFDSASLFDSIDSKVLDMTLGTVSETTLEVKTTKGIDTIGEYILKLVDSLYGTISFDSQKIYILETLTPTLTFTPKIVTIGDTFTLTVSSVEKLISAVTEASLYADTDATFTSPYSLSIKSQTSSQIILDSVSINNPGIYILRLKDSCGNYYLSSTNFEVAVIPDIISVKNFAMLNSNIDAIVTTNSITIDQVFISAYLEEINTNSIVNLTLTSLSKTTLQIFSNEAASVGIYTLKLVDFASRIKEYKAKYIYLLSTMSPTLKFTPIMKKKDDPITFTITSVEKLVAGQIVEAKLYAVSDSTFSSPLELNIVSQSTDVIVASINAVTNIGSYKVRLTAVNGDYYDVPTTLMVVNVPDLVSFSPVCVFNTTIDTTLNFAEKLENGVYTTIALTETDKKSVSLNMGTPIDTSLHVSKTNATPVLGWYFFRFTDFESNHHSHSAVKILVLSNLSRKIQKISPIAYSINEEILLKVTFDYELYNDQLTEMKLISPTGKVHNFDLGTLNKKVINVNLPAGVNEYGDYNIIYTDYCGATVTSKIKLVIAKRNSIDSFSPGCITTRKNFEFTVNMIENTILPNITSVTLVGQSGGANLLTITQSINATAIRASTAGISNAGEYTLRYFDKNEFESLSQTSLIVLVMPKILNMDPKIFSDQDKISFMLTMDSYFESEYLSYIVIEDENGVEIEPDKYTILTPTTIMVKALSYPKLQGFHKVKLYYCEGGIIEKTFELTSDLTISNDCDIGYVYDVSSNGCTSCLTTSQFYSDKQCVDICPDSYSLYEDYICVSSCAEYGAVSLNNICTASCAIDYVEGVEGVCTNCRNLGLFYFDNQCVESCPDNYALSSVTSECLLDISESNQRISLCEPNPCNSGTCTIEFETSYTCECPPEKVGLNCEEDKSNFTPEKMNLLINQLTSGKTSDADMGSLAKMANALLSQNSDGLFSNANANSLYNYAESVLSKITEGGKFTEDTAGVFNLVGLALNLKGTQLRTAQINRLKRASKQTRVLETIPTTEEDEKIKQQILKMLNVAVSFSKVYITKKPSFDTTSSIVMANPFVTIQIGFDTPESQSSFLSSSHKNNLTVIDIQKCLEKLTNQTYNSTHINKNSSEANFIFEKAEYKYTLNNYLNKTELESSTVFLEIRNFTSRELVNTSICQEDAPFLVKYNLSPTQQKSINLTTMSNYRKAGIDIYDQNDPAFTTRCSKAKEVIPYDTTLNYRKFNIFQNLSATCEGGNCTYRGIEDNGTVICECARMNSLGTSFKLQNVTLQSGSDYNLDVVTCPHLAFNKHQVHKNAGFWISSSLIIALIVLLITHNCVFNRYIKDKTKRHMVLQSDGIIIESDPQQQESFYEYVDPEKEIPNAGIVTNYEENITKAENIKTTQHSLPKTKKFKQNRDPVQIRVRENIKNDVSPIVTPSNENHKTDKNLITNYDNSASYTNFTNSFCLTILKVHPVLSLSHHSLINPFGIKVTKFFFNCLMYFSFNALIYSDYYILQRLYNTNRDSFVYPVIHEFSKIICSILITSLLSIVLKFIVHPHGDDLKNLKDDINKNDSDRQIIICHEFHKRMRNRYIVYFTIIGVFSIFFFYYNFVFCAVYINTAANWVYSGIWSILFVWLGLSPLAALVLVTIETHCKPKENSFMDYIRLTLQFIF